MQPQYHLRRLGRVQPHLQRELNELGWGQVSGEEDRVTEDADE
jgi:hypothetical protein